MTRVTHRLNLNAEDCIPAHRIYLDCESRAVLAGPLSETQSLRFGCLLAEHERRYRQKSTVRTSWAYFDTPDEAWDLIESHTAPKRVLTVYAHNFDFDAAMIEVEAQARRRGWACVQWARGKHWIYARFRKVDSTILLVDTMNYWPGSVEKLGQEIGKPKLSNPGLGAPIESQRAYCKRDVEIISTFMHSLFALHRQQKWGRFKPTLAGIAFHAYRHRYMTDRPLIIADAQLSELERRAFYGGRNECFRLGRVEGPIYQLDVNSMYPAMMHDREFPLEKVRSGNSLSRYYWQEIDGPWLTIADCTLVTELPLYPVHLNGRLIFPVGGFRTTLATPELSLAIQRGHLRSIGRYAFYKAAPLFRKYTSDLYALRTAYEQQGEKPLALVCKLLLNSLYGKFGQQGQRWEKCQDGYAYTEPSFVYDCDRSGKAKLHVTRYSEVWHQVREGEASDSLPSIAAHITSYARCYLWYLIEVAGRDNVYYVDTDALFVNERGYQRLASHTNPSELGYLKLADQYQWCHFYGAKDYQTDHSVKHKGIKANARKVADDLYQQEQFASYDHMLNEGIDGSIEVHTVTKRFNRMYAKGEVDRNGYTRPLRLTLGESPRTP